MRLKNQEEGWDQLIGELTASQPREIEVKTLMRQVGLMPKGDLLQCMEIALKALEGKGIDRGADREIV